MVAMAYAPSAAFSPSSFSLNSVTRHVPIRHTSSQRHLIPQMPTTSSHSFNAKLFYQKLRFKSKLNNLACPKSVAGNEDSVVSATTLEELSPEDQEDQQYVEQILRVLELLKTKRDMTLSEVRLTVMIEDPREVERRKALNIEDERGCSKDDMAAALLEVAEGRLPKDRVVLRELAKELMNWPNLEDEIAEAERNAISPYAKITNTGVDPTIAAQRARVDWDTAAEISPGEESKDLSQILPPVVGFSLLYLVSILPIVIGVVVVIVLFVNSVQ